MNDFTAYLEEQRERVNRALERLLPEARQPEIIYEAMRYSVAAGGSAPAHSHPGRGGDFGTDSGAVMEIACAVEFIHTYSRSTTTCRPWITAICAGANPPATASSVKRWPCWPATPCSPYAFELMARYGLERCAQKPCRSALNWLAPPGWRG